MKLSQALRIEANDVVAFVGGGGKSTAMFQLAHEASQAGKRVLVTTSTRIFAAQIKLAPAHVTFDSETQTLAEVLPDLDQAIDQHGQVLLIGQTNSDNGKAFGIAPDVIDTLAQSGHFDLIINEADGSRMRPFKAPAVHEPVISAATTLVVPVVGLDILGKPLNDETTHRANRVSQLSGTALEQPITTDTIVSILNHPEGGLKQVPSGARVVPLLNKVESSTQLATAQTIAKQLLDQDTQPIEAVALGAVQQTEEPITEVWGRTAVVILAAGGSSRFGSPKQLADWQGQTFVERAVDTALASQADLRIIVLGAEVKQSQQRINAQPIQIVINEAWAEGQSTSMKAGLAAVPDSISAVIFSLVDLPRITPDIIDQLISRHRQTLAPLVWPEFEGKRGNPVLFDKQLFDQLAKIEGDQGGRPIIKAYQAVAERVKVDDNKILQDFDDPETLAKIASTLTPEDD
ncbi:MAG: selenium cofactor biosynthesis protein YqeC [Chloroflexota bacterium]